MKLLFDENLSPRLIARVAEAFPDCVHIEGVGLRGFADEFIWSYAQRNGLTIVSKDNDFRQRAFLFGPPPQVVWLEVGNAGTLAIGALIIARRQSIVDFVARSNEGLLVLSIP